MSETFPIIALTGPSGVGKGYLGNLIKTTFVNLVDLPVYTTRLPRPDETNSTNRVFLDDPSFDAMVLAGAVLLDHRPFRDPETPRYGFDRTTLLQPTAPIFTEVHSSLVSKFKLTIPDRPTLLVGVLASEATQKNGIETRQGSFNDGVPANARLDLAAIETQEIRTAHAQGLIDLVLDYDPEVRAVSENQLVDTVSKFLGVPHE